MANVYQIVTDRIIRQLEQGVIPWRRPWTERGTRPLSWKTGKPYRGVNAFLLEPGEYATLRQINEAGGRVKKSAKSEIVVFWRWVEKKDEETGEVIDRWPVLRYYHVFNVATQCEGIEPRWTKGEVHHHDPIEAAERIVLGYVDRPVITYTHDRAYYSPLADTVAVPPLSDYANPAEYYSTLFHELVHSTGHEKRLAREEIVKGSRFGDEDYSREELVAEFGAAMLCAVAGIENRTIENSAAYIAGWLRALKNDHRMAVIAASRAQRAADYILGQAAEDDVPQTGDEAA